MARVSISKFDAADYLRTEEEFAEYLAAAAEGGDAAHFVRALGTVARARNMSKLARESGISREGLYKALSGEGNPSLDTAMRVMKSLGFTIAVKTIGKKQTARKKAPTRARPSVRRRTAAQQPR
jgi:probable addiction module antidote protein